MVIAVWIASMIGYDKVLQLAKQAELNPGAFKKEETPENEDKEEC